MLRHFSAGGVVYRKSDTQILFLVCKSSDPTSKSPWCLPKGWLDDVADGVPGPKTLGLKHPSTSEVEEAALREVREEAGVEAKIISKIGFEKFVFTDQNKEKVFKIVTFFLMEYVRDLPEGFGFETSEIVWVPAIEAYKLLAKRKGEADLIRKAETLI